MKYFWPVTANDCSAPVSCRTVTASCWPVPSATLVIWRYVLFVASPTDTAPSSVWSVVSNGIDALPLRRMPDDGTTARSATEPEPSAMLPSTLEIAFGPIATLSTPTAWLSGAVEFAWKYLMPCALMLSIAEPTLLLIVVDPSLLYVTYDGAEIVPVVGS
ncbi:hypothetical protein IST439_06032 [Burkholderia cenocepacia]|nr:hypothetical protein IST439_06032 [Burkholderia cenocepacia]